ncbi:MAG: DUF3769 domain-containing protein [Cyanobacteria bacterium Co-bin13]|nr:DUF3769 domain-containing protein [Cyanobacteria bacterium Co-bin13]
MPFPLILSEIPAVSPAAEVSPHLAESTDSADADDPLPFSEVPVSPIKLPSRSELAEAPVSFSAQSLLLNPESPNPGQPSQIPRISPTSDFLTLDPLAPLMPSGGQTNEYSQGQRDQGGEAPGPTEPLVNSTLWNDGAFPLQTVAEIEVASPQPTPESTQNPPLLLRADRQSYSPSSQIVSAFGNVQVQFGDAQLFSNRLWANLRNRFIRAEEDVLFNRNNQIIGGSSATYNLLQGAGSILDAQGELSLTEVDRDFSADFRVTGSSSQVVGPANRPIQDQGTISSVTSPGGLSLGTDDRALAGGEGGNINRLRFEAERIDFDATGWYAEGIRLTNDPFSPPEIEFRGDTARLTPISPEEDELLITNARVVFDQGFSIPLLRDRIILRRGQVDPSELNPIPTNVGIDGRDRSGLFVERAFSFSPGGLWRLSIVPQFYLQRWVSDSGGNIADPANFGIVTSLNGPLGPRTLITATASLPGLDLENLSDRLRASVRGQRLIGDHILNLEYSYRDRLFNGSLGFQDVQSSLGAVLLSPVVRLGDTQIDLTYQVSGQYVTAATDRPELIGENNASNLTSLFRFQGSVALSRAFLLWQGQGLPPTPTQGLRYSPRPVVPFLQLVTQLRGITTYYSSDDLQENLTASVRLEGQVGHFSRPFLDYTQFNVGYSRTFVGGATSPFLFDRNVDQNVLSGGLLQQIYGPFRAGFQTALNLDTGRFIETDLVFEYSRRAYGLLLRYNPAQTSGFLGFRLSDFDWVGRSSPFDSRDY